MGQAAVNVKAERASAPIAQETTAWRVDLYVGVHKGLRALMSDVLATVGRADAHDPADVGTAMKQVRGLLDACRLHLHKENQFLHPAMEGRRPGAAGQTADDHVHHEQAIEQLEADVLAVERSPSETRAAAALKLYRRLALFVADNYQHMHVEETDNNAVLWAAYTDEELLEIQHALVASIPPQWMAVFLRWMVPAMAPAERAALLTTIQQGAPTEVFERILASVKPHLDERDWTKLMAALGPVPFGFC